MWEADASPFSHEGSQASVRGAPVFEVALQESQGRIVRTRRVHSFAAMPTYWSCKLTSCPRITTWPPKCLARPWRAMLLYHDKNFLTPPCAPSLSFPMQ